MLPPYSPKTSKPTPRSRMSSSEPRKTPTTTTSIHTSTLQRRLPFERMMSHKYTPSKYFPPI